MVNAYTEVGRRLRESPGVEAAGAVTGLPLASTRGDWGIRIEGRPVGSANIRSRPTGRWSRPATSKRSGHRCAPGGHLPMPIAPTRCP